jgi:hypothetical protein
MTEPRHSVGSAHNLFSATFGLRQQHNRHDFVDVTEPAIDARDGSLRNPLVSHRTRQNLPKGVRFLHQLREDWYWVLVSGFLLYLSGFEPEPWYWRIIAPIGVLVVSSALYRRWVTKRHGPGDHP